MSRAFSMPNDIVDMTSDKNEPAKRLLAHSLEDEATGLNDDGGLPITNRTGRKETPVNKKKSGKKKAPQRRSSSVGTKSSSAGVPNPNKRQGDKNHSTTTSLSVATYNVWFGTTGYEKERMGAIIEALTPHSPNLIGFQEVTPPLARTLCPLLESLNYHTILQPFGGYVCAIACKVDNVIQSGFHPFSNSQMGRGIVWALVEHENREILFTTTHLESYMDVKNTGGPEREVQLLEMMEFCNRCMRERDSLDLTLITGDLNWDDERVRSEGHNRKLLSLVDETKWVDTYRQVEATAKGYTYDPKENPMLAGGNIRRRFDRILARKRGGTVQVSDVEMVGKEAIPGLSYMTPPSRWHGPKKRLVAPSDHFGLVSKLGF